ncbi:hypothetical protein [Solitalea koreensis]|uniref:Uncharacterized protein n=1 Tax=Solitalea koreensis TaxID=543615 RepID=A0A521BMU9_9SPHI|nr:hypothetical protein [Solitalea koreensis]SMO48432.1 hypothetical protein SAMN06265350_102346 [Solitalea koreensis]
MENQTTQVEKVKRQHGTTANRICELLCWRQEEEWLDFYQKQKTAFINLRFQKYALAQRNALTKSEYFGQWWQNEFMRIDEYALSVLEQEKAYSCIESLRIQYRMAHNVIAKAALLRIDSSIHEALWRTEGKFNQN